MKISVVIVASGNDIERYVNLIQCLKAIKSQTISDYEIVIVEQAIGGMVWYYDKIPMDNNMKHIKLFYADHPNLFNLCWCRNVGIYNSSGDILICLDMDYVFDNRYFEAILNNGIKNYCIGWSKIYYIHEPEKIDIIQNNRFPVGREEFINTNTLQNKNVGGSQIFNRQWFIENIVGYCEDMFKWGVDDTDANGRSWIISGEWNILDYTIYHLHHHTKQAEVTNNHIIKDRNCENPTITAKLMQEKGVAKLECPSPIYDNSIERALL